MKVVIRADASQTIGSGHVMRCLTLADLIRQDGGEVTFVSRELPGNLNDLIEKQGYPVRRLPVNNAAPHESHDIHAEWSTAQDAEQTTAAIGPVASPDWLIVDHYGLDIGWHGQLRAHVDRLMVIDDLANRTLDADLLLDQNLYESAAASYDDLVPAECQVLTGPKFALLRPQFSRSGHAGPVTRRDGLFIFYGGSDPTDESSKALEALLLLARPDLEADLVIGAANPHHRQLEIQAAAQASITVHHQIPHIASLMRRRRLALGAGGVTTWERCAVGLPCLISAVADNQVRIASSVDRLGAARYLGQAADVTANDMAHEIEHLLDSPDQIENMATAGRRLVDGQGTERVLTIMKKLMEVGALS